MDEKNLINKIKKGKDILNAESRFKVAVRIYARHGKAIFKENRNGLYVKIDKIDLKIMRQIVEIIDETKAADRIDYSDIMDIVEAPDHDAAVRKLKLELKAFKKLKITERRELY